MNKYDHYKRRCYALVMADYWLEQQEKPEVRELYNRSQEEWELGRVASNTPGYGWLPDANGNYFGIDRSPDTVRLGTLYQTLSFNDILKALYPQQRIESLVYRFR